MLSPEQIASNYRSLREDIPDEVTIVAATKTRSAREVRAVIEAGAPIIGENYVQEAQSKMEALGEEARRAEWHMIGHLQRNKVRDALRLFGAVQSLDSPRLARAIDRRADAPVPVLIEVNIGEEDSKYGIIPAEVGEFARLVLDLDNLDLRGLMTMEPYFEDPEKARPYFRRMRRLYDGLRQEGVPVDTLSMGMTHSYRVAIQEGSTMVRPGTAIFGPRE